MLVEAGQRPGASSGARPTGELTPADLVEIEAKVAIEMGKLRMNAVEKAKKLREAFDMAWIAPEERLMMNVIDFSGGRESRAYRVARQRAWWKAEHAWLKANPGDDIDAEHVALHHKLAQDDLDYATSLEIALLEVEEIENNFYNDEGEPVEPSRTQKRLKEKLREQMDGAGRWLSYALTSEQAALVERLAYRDAGTRTWRWSPRWRFCRDKSRNSGVRVSRLDARLCVRLAESFEQCIRYTDTQRDVRALLSCWAEEAKLVRDADGTRFEGRGFTIYAI